MKNLLLIIFLLSFISVFSQKKNLEKENELIALEYSIVSDKCVDSTNWKEKKKCSVGEVRNIIKQEFNTEIYQKLKTGNYRIWFVFNFDTPNNKPKITVECKTEILKNEARRIIATQDFQVSLLNENGQTVIGKYKVPIHIGIIK